MNVILWLLLLTHNSGHLCLAYSCLTWELHQNELKLIFKTNNFSTSVTFYDNFGTERGFCNFNTPCKNITYEREQREVVLNVVQLSDISGIWSCQQGFYNYTTDVISTGDIRKSTHLEMQGSIIHRQNKTLVQVKCASCREPYRNQVHYLFNKRLGDIVSYQFKSNICTNNNGVCKGSTCSCSPHGNLFIRAYEKDGDNTMTFACAMKFTTILQDFVKVSHLVYDGKDGFTFTVIEDRSPTENESSNVTSIPSIDEGMEMWVLVAIICIGVVLLIVVSYLWNRRRRKDKGKRNEPEELPMLDNPGSCMKVIDSYDANNDGLKRWIVLKICLHGIVSVSLRVYVKRFVESLFNFWENKVNIKSQSFRCHVADYHDKIKLNYSAINSNKTKLDKQMDYKVRNYIDFSKLFLPTSLTGYSDFDSKCDIESLLELVIQINEFPSNIREQAGKLLYNVLKPCKHKNYIEDYEYDTAIETLKRLIKLLNCNRDADLDICKKYGMSAVDQEFIDDMQLPSCTAKSIEEKSTSCLIQKCQSIQESAGSHSGQLVDNLADESESVATQPTETESSMTDERNIISEHIETSAVRIVNDAEELGNTQCDSTKRQLFQQVEVFPKPASNLADVTSSRVDDLHNRLRHLDEKFDMMYRQQTDLLESVVEKWVEADKHYIPTGIGNQIEKLLQQHSCVTITGPPGCGKSFTARHIAIALQLKNKFNIVPIYAPRDLHKYYQKGEKTVFIVDDLCGKFYIDDQLAREWQQQIDVVNAIKRNSACKIIACCRLQVFRDEMFRGISPFMSCACNMRDIPLTVAERSDMLKQYTQQRLKDWQLDWIYSRTDSVFPLLCSQYMRQKDTSRSINDYFIDPYFVFKEELDILFRGDHSCKILLCGLCVLVLRNNRVDKSWLKGKVTPAQRELFDDLSDALGLDKRISKANIIQALETLEETFVKQYVASYESINEYIFEKLVRYFSERALECIIDHSVPDFIHEKLSWQTRIVDPTVVIIPLDSAHIYLKRLVREWSEGNVYRVFNDRNMKIEKARTMLIDHLDGVDVSKRECLVNKIYLAGKDHIYADTTALIQASYLGFHDLAKWLTGNQSHVDLRDKNGRSALEIAYNMKDLKMIGILLRRKANCNVTDKDENPLLCWAISNGNYDLTKLLIEKGAEINSKNKRGESALHCACRHGHVETVRLLLENEADANILDKNNISPLLMACFQNLEKGLIGLLLKVSHVTIVNRSGMSPLYWSSYNGNLDLVSLLLNRDDCEVDIINNEHDTPLHIACYRRQEEIIYILLKKKAKVNSCDLDGATPLYYACLSEGLDSPIPIVKLLLSYQTDPNTTLITGETVLALVVMRGYVDIVQLLLEAGADCKLSIYTKRHMASSIEIKKLKSLKNKVHKLLSKILPNKPKTKDIRSCDDMWDLYAGSSPLHFACLLGHLNITRLLLQNGALFNAEKEGCKSPLYFACEFGHLDIVKLLIENGPDKLTTVQRKSLSDIAADCGHTHIVEYLSNLP